jgi:hypothetical protein
MGSGSGELPPDYRIGASARVVKGSATGGGATGIARRVPVDVK